MSDLNSSENSSAALDDEVQSDARKSRRAVWAIIVIVLLAALLVGAVIGGQTHWYGLGHRDSAPVASTSYESEPPWCDGNSQECSSSSSDSDDDGAAPSQSPLEDNPPVMPPLSVSKFQPAIDALNAAVDGQATSGQKLNYFFVRYCTDRENIPGSSYQSSSDGESPLQSGNEIGYVSDYDVIAADLYKRLLAEYRQNSDTFVTLPGSLAEASRTYC